MAYVNINKVVRNSRMSRMGGDWSSGDRKNFILFPSGEPSSCPYFKRVMLGSSNKVNSAK